MAFFAIAALVFGVGLTAKSTIDASKAEKKQVRATLSAREEARKRDDLVAQREARKQIAEARRLRAASIQSGISQGVGPTSSVIEGATSSTQSQLGGNLGFLSGQNSYNSSISAFQDQASIFGGKVNTANAMSGLGQTIFSVGLSLQKSQSEPKSPTVIGGGIKTQ